MFGPKHSSKESHTDLEYYPLNKTDLLFFKYYIESMRQNVTVRVCKTETSLQDI